MNVDRHLRVRPDLDKIGYGLCDGNEGIHRIAIWHKDLEAELRDVELHRILVVRRDGHVHTYSRLPIPRRIVEIHSRYIIRWNGRDIVCYISKNISCKFIIQFC